MTVQPVLINGEWRQAQDSAGVFSPVNPTTGEPMPEQYPVSVWEDVQAMLEAARAAVVALRSVPPDNLADFLDVFAGNIEARADALVALAHLETGLPEEPRLRSVELPRTTDQLRQAAEAARERSWCMATIDTAVNIRSMYGPLDGPVAVFGPNNFPFAFNSSAGGDFAAAIAAGNPVIAKANPGHPGTTRLLAEAAYDALTACELPPALVQLIYRVRPEDGLRLVSHPLVGATAFTGSRWGGLKLKEAADTAGKPIYLEMSSVNPVFVLPGALQERADEVAGEFTGSCLLGTGQFCTNPGLVILVGDDAGEAFLRDVSGRFEAAPVGVLLSEYAPQDIADALETLTRHGAAVVTGGKVLDEPGIRFQNTLLRVSGQAFLREPEALQTEAFGPVSLFVVAEEERQLVEIAGKLEGGLTGSIYSDRVGSDDALYTRLEAALRPKVGRLLNDKMPTGVAVSPAMNHGGPYPSTGHPGFTAVGIPASMQRFGALYCYDNVRPARLPENLRDANPTGRMWRYIDRAWTQGKA
jgi:2,5-dioxopentanoate dehydrogenase